MSVDFNRIEGGNEDYNCCICINGEKGQFVCHTGEGGDRHPIHEICAKEMLYTGEAKCTLCKRAVNLSSLLNPYEIAQREDHQAAERIVGKLEQEDNDARFARELGDEEVARRLDGALPLRPAARIRAAIARPPRRRAEINPCIAAAVFLGALIVASFAKGWFV